MGRSESGKSLFVTITKEIFNKDVNILKKYTIRPPRIDEVADSNSDHFFITNEEYNKLKETTESYNYIYGNDRKLIEKERVVDSVKKHKNSIIIIGNISVMKQMKTELESFCNVYAVWIYAEKNAIRQRLANKNYSQKATNERISNCEELWEMKPNKKVFDFIISNTDSVLDFKKKVLDFSDKYFK